jgi:hypothetical protein
MYFNQDNVISLVKNTFNGLKVKALADRIPEKAITSGSTKKTWRRQQQRSLTY